MNVIICIDDYCGMLFNNRRQSRDIKVIEDIATLTKELWICPFSEILFLEPPNDIGIKINNSELFLQSATSGEFCFVEDQKLMPYINDIEKLIVYKWNREYPSDFKLDLNLDEWKLIDTVEFIGNSHKKITREIYVQ